MTSATARRSARWRSRIAAVALLLCGCDLSGALPGALTGGAPSARCREAVAALVPGALSDISLGMSLGDFRRQWPDAQADDFNYTGGVHKWFWLGDLPGDSLFGGGSFVFHLSKLDALILGGGAESGVLEPDRAAFLDLLHDRLGAPAELWGQVLSTPERTYHQAVLVWLVDNCRIEASYAPARSLDGRPYDEGADPFAPLGFRLWIYAPGVDSILLAKAQLIRAETLGADEFDHLFDEAIRAGLVPTSGRRSAEVSTNGA